jgi:hypothetical protein
MKNKGNALLYIFIIVLLVTLGILVIYFKNSGQKASGLKGINIENILPKNEKKEAEQASEAQTGKKMFLEVISPKNGSTFTSSPISVKGSSLPYAEIFINDVETKADSLGNFSVNLTLEEGENMIYVLANDSLGNFLENELAVTLQTFE